MNRAIDQRRNPLNPGFRAQSEIYGHDVGAIHEPDTRGELEQPCHATTTVAGK
jgi:hypothetical protein